MQNALSNGEEHDIDNSMMAKQYALRNSPILTKA
jgi:hypothetical protein